MMIVRDLNFLLQNEFKKATLDIIENRTLSLVYVSNRGYALYFSEDDERRDTFLIKSDFSPEQLNLAENSGEKEDFVDLIEMFLGKVYDGFDIPEFEKKHPEFVLLKFIDLFEKDDIDFIDSSSELYNLISNGFSRLDIDVLLLNSK